MSQLISIHVPREGNDAEDRGGRQEHHHFNPRSPRGERRKTPWAITSTGNFNPRSPRGERPFRITAYLSPELFQSTFPARGTTQHSCKAGTTPKISIHVPREGNDLGAYSSIRYGFHFNPRSPRGERPVHNCRPNDLVLFQSTFPARGTTHVAIVFVGLLPFQSTFPARGTTVEIRAFNYNRVISIHVPREGNDILSPGWTEILKIFQSTFPARGTTCANRREKSLPANFNPRSPRGERRHVAIVFVGLLPFQSTFPARGTT